MEKFIYKKHAGITALSASFTDFRYKRHSHREYAIGVTLRGIQQYHMNGCLQSSHQYGIMLFNPEQPHDGMAHDKSGIDYVMLYIDPDMFLEIIGKKDIVKFSSPIVYDSLLCQKILDISMAVLDEKDEALCSDLFLSLSEKFCHSSLFELERKDKVFVKKAKDMIRSDLENVLKLDDICMEFNISKFKFIRMFKENTGITPYQFFLISKVERAKEVIEKTKDIYSAVAECGFVDLTHLNKHFKSIYGITAFQYRSYISG